MGEFNMSSREMAALFTKKIWEKVIGAKYNSNDEVNHIAQQAALTNMGMAQLGPVGGKSGKKKGSS
jgi:hypothetical protein